MLIVYNCPVLLEASDRCLLYVFRHMIWPIRCKHAYCSCRSFLIRNDDFHNDNYAEALFENRKMLRFQQKVWWVD